MLYQLDRPTFAWNNHLKWCIGIGTFEPCYGIAASHTMEKR